MPSNNRSWCRSGHCTQAASLSFAGFPERDGDSLRYAAGNGVGDAMVLYALSSGPLFDRVTEALR